MAKTEARNTGISLEVPKQSCSDKRCPFHGALRLRGRQFNGIVISSRMRKTAVIEFKRLYFLKKYERYEKRRTRLKAHNPDCIGAKEGDIVNAMECRPLSKSKNIVIIQKVGVEKGFMVKMEAREAAKIDKPKKEESKEEKER